MIGEACPFCGTAVNSSLCSACGRDVTANRRICEGCQQMSPTAETKCCHCGKRFGSELSWQIPTIILLFVVAFILAVVVNLLM